MQKIIILEDHKGYTFTSLTNNETKSIDNNLLKRLFIKMGYDVVVASLHEIDKYDVRNSYVFYPSSEVSGLFYKEYIEDVLLMLKLRGAILLPRIELFRAHHNKAFMERIKTNIDDKSLNTIQTEVLYDIYDLKKNITFLEKKIKYPMVLKMSSGSGARGVALANNRNELYRKFSKMSAIRYRDYGMPWYSSIRLSQLKCVIEKYLFHKRRKLTYPQEKMIIQSFLPNLKYDYKVLVFGEKYYVLKRMTRDNDFRASGSGKLFFDYPFNDELIQVLNMAKKLYSELDAPLLSVDIAFDGKNSHLIEFQCVNFGPYTLQFSDKYFTQKEGNWVEIRGKSILEEEIAKSLDYYIKEHVL